VNGGKNKSGWSVEQRNPSGPPDQSAEGSFVTLLDLLIDRLPAGAKTLCLKGGRQY
jgi:hypothetical protein